MNKSTQIKIPTESWKKLRQLKEKTGRTITSMIKFALEEYLKKIKT